MKQTLNYTLGGLLMLCLIGTTSSCATQTSPSEQPVEYSSADAFFNIASKVVSGTNQGIDPHDLFHWWASVNIPENKRNHYMICGCAYIYGGSWGISWEDIQQQFNHKMLNGVKHDWLSLYMERYNFGESMEKHLLITQYINAKIIEKVTKEQGYAAAMELLHSGDMRKHRKEFFEVLNRVTGINEQNFNEKITGYLN